MAKDELDDYPAPSVDELDSFPIPSTKEHGAFAEGRGGGFDPVELAPTVPSNAGKYSAKNPDGTYVNPNFNVPVSEKIPAMQAGAAGKELVTSPVATLTNPSKRRELERGVSDMATLGLAEKAGNAVDPKFAATAEADPSAAPGMRTVGAAIGAPLPSAVNNVIGRAVGTGVQGASKAITALAPKAEARAIEGAATALGEGATKATKGKLGIGNEGLTETREGAATRNVLKGDEELVKVADKGDKKLAPVAKRIREVASKKLDEIYANSDAAASRLNSTQIRPKFQAAFKHPVSGDIVKTPGIHDYTALPDGIAHEYDAGFVDQNGKFYTRQDAAKALDPMWGAYRALDSKELRHFPDGGTPIQVSGPVGIPANSPVSAMTERIVELNKGTVEDRAVAKKLKEIRDEFSAAHGEGDYIPARKLRDEQSAYQLRGYGKSKPGEHDVAASIEANREASKAVGDAVVKHVTGVKYDEAVKMAQSDPTSVAAQLLKANEQVAVANKIEAAIKSRVGSNPGSPHRLTQIVDSAVHGVSAMGATAATMLHHPGVAAGIVAVDAARTAAPYALKLTDKTVIALSHVPANPQIVKYAQKMGALGMKAAQIDLAVKRLNKEQENVAGPE
jgi:hypothetical protein